MWALAFLAATVAISFGVHEVLRQQPLAELAARPTPTVGLEMKDLVYTAYDEKGRLVTEAKVSEMTATRDRVSVQLTNVRDGIFHMEDKSKLKYAANAAVYNPPIKRLTGEGLLTLEGKDFRLATQEAIFDGRTNVLTISRAVRGLLGGGMVDAQALTYNLKERTGQVVGITWRGQPPDGANPTPGAARDWTVSAERTDLRGGTYIHSKGRATDGEVIVIADRIEQNTQTQVLVATGNVRYHGRDANVTCGRATIYRRERRAVFETGVDMLIKPKDSPAPQEEVIPPLQPVVPNDIARTLPAPSADPSARDAVRDSENLRRYPIAVRADKVEYWYAAGQRRAVVTGNPQARQQIAGQGWRMMWAPQANYDGEREILTMNSAGSGRQVRFINSLGDDLAAVQVEVSTREGDDTMSAKDVQGTVNIEDDEIPDRGNTGGGGGTTGGSGPSLSGPIGRRV
jgi:lipopolysaccharide export system protein LptA